MKKLFFTAIALVAFSGVSMANNSAENETKINLDSKIVLEIDCIQVAIAALEAADPNNQMTNTQANNFYQGQYLACERSKSLSAN